MSAETTAAAVDRGPVLETLKAKRGESLEQMFASVAGTRASDARVGEIRS